MKELIIAFGLFLFIEGILYALFPSKMKSMFEKNGDDKRLTVKKWWFSFCSYRFYNYLVYKKLK